MSFNSYYALKLLIPISALRPYTGDVKESFYRKRITTIDLLLGNLTNNLNRYLKMSSLI